MVLPAREAQTSIGNVEQLATGVKKIYDKVAEVRSAQPTSPSHFPKSIPQKSRIPLRLSKRSWA
jgi:hypothetical protein